MGKEGTKQFKEKIREGARRGKRYRLTIPMVKAGFVTLLELPTETLTLAGTVMLILLLEMTTFGGFGACRFRYIAMLGNVL